MFCKICGRENNDENRYCVHDGVKLSDDSVNFNFKSSMNSFCSECGYKCKKEDTYCASCGKELYVVEKIDQVPKLGTEGINIQMSSIKDLGLSGLLGGENKEVVSQDYMYGLMGFIAMIFSSLLVSGQINKVFNMMLEGEIGLNINAKIVGFLDTLAFLNLGSLKVGLNGGGDYLNVEMKPGLYILALLPLIIFVAIGMVKAKKDLPGNIHLIQIPINGLIYGGLVAIISIFTRRTLNLPLPILGDIVSINKNFGFISLLIKATILSSLGMLIGYSLYLKIKQVRLENKLEEGIMSGSLIFGILSSSLILVLFILIFDGIAEISDLIPITQIAAYGFGFLNLGSISFNTDSDFENISIIGNFKEILNFIDVNLVFVLALVLIPIVVFLIKGFKDKNKGRDFYITPIIYSILTLVFMKLLSIDIIIPGDTRLLIEPNLLVSAIGVLLVSLLPNFAGYLLAGGDKDEV